MKDKDFKIKSIVVNMKWALIPLSLNKVLKSLILHASYMPEIIQGIFVWVTGWRLYSIIWVRIIMDYTIGIFIESVIRQKKKLGVIVTLCIPAVQNKEHIFFSFLKWRHSKQIEREKNQKFKTKFLHQKF